MFQLFDWRFLYRLHSIHFWFLCFHHCGQSSTVFRKGEWSKDVFNCKGNAHNKWKESHVWKDITMCISSISVSHMWTKNTGLNMFWHQGIIMTNDYNIIIPGCCQMRTALAGLKPMSAFGLHLHRWAPVLHRIVWPTGQCDPQGALLHIVCNMHAARLWSRQASSKKKNGVHYNKNSNKMIFVNSKIIWFEFLLQCTPFFKDPPHLVIKCA